LPKYVENFEGGFKFDSFNYSDSSLKNDDGSTAVKAKDADFDYKRDGEKNAMIQMAKTVINK